MRRVNTKNSSTFTSLLSGTESLSDDDKGTRYSSTSQVGFFSWIVLQIVFIHSISGAFFGYCIGFVAPYYTFVAIGEDCTLITADNLCGSSHSYQCQWVHNSCRSAKNSCTYFQETELFKEVDAGVANSSSSFELRVCTEEVGFSEVKKGIFAAALIVGACIGSPCAGTILSLLGRKRSFLLSGLLACVSALFTHLPTYYGQYTTLIFGRIIAGIAAGILCVASPMYVNEMVSERHREYVGLFFQISCTLFTFFAALIGVVLKPRDFSTELHMQLRQQGLCIPSTIIGVVLVLSGVFMKESPVWKKEMARRRNVSHNTYADEIFLNEPLTNAERRSGVECDSETIEYTWVSMKGLFFTSCILCVAQQLTGIGAVMNYAPTVMSFIRLDSLTCNLLIMAWNFITVLISIPLLSRLQPDRMYIVALFGDAVSCIIAGMAMHPNIGRNATLKHVFSSIGIASSIAFFEMGMGTFFWTLSQRIFPLGFRSRGSSFTVLLQFIFNVIINVCFPIAVKHLSSRNNPTHEEGTGVAFIFFGCVGLLSGLYLLKSLRIT